MILVDKIESAAKHHRSLGEKLLLPPTILIHDGEESIEQFSNNYFTEVLWCALTRTGGNYVAMVARRIKVRFTRECSSINCSVAREDNYVAKA